MKRICSLLLAGLLLLLPLSACSAPAQSGEVSGSSVDNQTRTVVDMLGREVEVPADIKRIVCTGSNALRMVSYLQATDLLVGVEETDLAYETSTKRDYAHVYYDTFQNLPVIGKGGGTAYTAYPEEVLAADPDVILTYYVQEAAEQLQSETGIPVVSIRSASANFIDQDWQDALRLTADLLGKEERCQELLDYIEDCKADLQARSASVPEEDKPTVYTGAVTFSGSHGFAGTYANFGPFLAVNARNVADETEEDAFFEVDLEQVLMWDPDIIFLDPGNLSLVEEEYASNPDFFNALTAVQQGQVYTMPSFNNYSTNTTYCLIDAYFTGTVLYPEQFADVDLEEKGNEILTEFLGKAYFDEMEADGLYYGTIHLGE